AGGGGGARRARGADRERGRRARRRRRPVGADGRADAARGVEALVGDVQDLPFADGSFDCALAAWMLYHVPELDRGLAELARVLRRGGRLVAVTNSEWSLRELWELVGSDPAGRYSFGAE